GTLKASGQECSASTRNYLTPFHAYLNKKRSSICLCRTVKWRLISRWQEIRCSQTVSEKDARGNKQDLAAVNNTVEEHGGEDTHFNGDLFRHEQCLWYTTVNSVTRAIVGDKEPLTNCGPYKLLDSPQVASHTLKL
ncbi:hypothetical protein OTU49_002691, partial [Cherax quadricarinatus]